MAKRRIQGIVTSDKMDKTITVEVEHNRLHPRYKKYVRSNSSLKAHDPHEEAGPGDLVELESTRPLSKSKSWRLLHIVRRSAETEVGEESQPSANTESL